MFNIVGRRSFTLTSAGERSCQHSTLQVYSSFKDSLEKFKSKVKHFSVEINEPPTDDVLILKTDLSQSEW